MKYMLLTLALFATNSMALVDDVNRVGLQAAQTCNIMFETLKNPEIKQDLKYKECLIRLAEALIKQETKK